MEIKCILDESFKERKGKVLVFKLKPDSTVFDLTQKLRKVHYLEHTFVRVYTQAGKKLNKDDKLSEKLGNGIQHTVNIHFLYEMDCSLM